MDASTTEKILLGAAEIFAESGFDAARVDTIAERCGVNKASLYYHFKDKENLYNAVIRRYLTLAKAVIERDLVESSDAFEQLRVYIFAMFGCFHEGRFLSPIMLREAASGGRNLSRETLEIMRGFLGRFRTLLEEGAASGAFRSADLGFIHMSAISTIHFLIGSEPLRKRFVDEGLLEPDRLPPTDPVKNAQTLYDLIATYLKKESR